jgi:hypothetical protein
VFGARWVDVERHLIEFLAPSTFCGRRAFYLNYFLGHLGHPSEQREKQLEYSRLGCGYNRHLLRQPAEDRQRKKIKGEIHLQLAVAG